MPELDEALMEVAARESGLAVSVTPRMPVNRIVPRMGNMPAPKLVSQPVRGETRGET